MYCFGAKLQNNADMGKKIKRKLPISPFFFEIWARKSKENCPYLYFFSRYGQKPVQSASLILMLNNLTWLQG